MKLGRYSLILIAGTLACNGGEGGRDSGFGEDSESMTATMSGPGSDTNSGSGSESGSTGSDTMNDSGDDGNPVEEFIEEAKKEFPSYLDLHTKVIQRTCTPFENVCHANKEFPDLRTPSSMLDRINQPCNIVENNVDPTEVFNGCEEIGDTIRFTSGGNIGFETEVAFVEYTLDAMDVTISAQIHLRDAIPNGMTSPTIFESVEFERNASGSMLTVGTIVDQASYAAGNTALQINNWDLLLDSERTLLEMDLRYGDPNQDGTFGATEGEQMREILPGDPWNSYLLQRLQGNVPGSPMPLANQPLSAPEVIALACWIETTGDEDGDRVDSMIDYDNCEYLAEFDGEDDVGAATFSGQVLPILQQTCAADVCHGEARKEMLDLRDDVAYESLMAQSIQNPDSPLVTPLNPTNSYLITKLTGNGLSGERMPLGGEALTDSQLETIRTWIIQGAPDN